MLNLKSKALIFLLGLTTFGCFTTGAPEDKTMEENFHLHLSEFNKLAKMFSKDAHLGSIDRNAAYLPTITPAEIRTKAEIPSERLDEYRRLLRRANINYLARIKNGIIFSPRSGDSLSSPIDPAETNTKNYVYLETPLTELSDQQQRVSQNSDLVFAYKKIADRWYLEFMQD